MEENEEEEKETIDIEFTEKKDDPENDKDDYDFRWLDVQEETRKILLRLISLRV